MRSGRAARRLALAVAASVLLAGAGALIHVPEGRLAFVGRSEGGAARLLQPGWHLRIPVLERKVLIAAGTVRVEGAASWITPEGAEIEIPYRMSIDPGTADPAAILREAPDGDLEGAVRRLAAAAIREDGAGGGTPAGGPEGAGSGPERERIEARLAVLGLVPGSLAILDARPRGAGGGSALAALRSAWQGPRHPVLLVGIDAADWSVMGPMIDRGELPALAALKRRGAWGTLKSSVPALSPLLWTTVATGKTPDQHGIVDFLAEDPATGRQVPITSRSRKAKALWSILNDLGRPSLTVGWWATWPVEKVEGAMVSDRVAYSLLDAGSAPALAEAAHPASAVEAASRRIVRPEDVTLEEAARIVRIGRADYEKARALLSDPRAWSDPVAHLLRVLAATRTYHAIALDLLAKDQPPLSLVYYEGLDEVNHRFAHYAPPAMKWADPAKVPAFEGAVEGFYRFQDSLVGELVEAAGPDTVVLVVSDHGFAWGAARPADVPPDIEGKPGRWHTLDGIILAAGPPVRPGRLPADPGLLDIAPTVLALLSLPAAADMPGTAIAEIAQPRALPPPPEPRIASYESPERGSPQTAAGDASPVDEEMMAKLTALGYIGAAGEAAPADPGEGDPRSSAPGTVTGHVNAANVFLAKGDCRAAEPEYRAALAMAPRFVPARLGLAQCHVLSGREDEGWREVRAVLVEGGDLDPGIYGKVARLYAQRGRAAAGAEVFDQIPRREGFEAARLAARGMLLARAGREREAEEALRGALREDAAFGPALQEIYQILKRRGADAELIEILERAIAAGPGASLPASLLALTYERAGRGEEGARLLTRHLESNPRDLAAMVNLAAIMIRRGDAASALPLLRRARDVDPSNVGVLANLVLAQGKSGDFEGARRVFSEAGEAAERSELLNAMAMVCLQNGRTGEARDLITRSLRRNPDQPEARRLLGEIDDRAAPGDTPSSAEGPGL